MAGGSAAAWTLVSGVRAYREAWEARAPPPAFEPGPFLIRIQSLADLLAAVPWRLLAWENPFARGGPASGFWDLAMLTGEGSATAPSLLPYLAAAGARVDGLRLLSGELVVKVELGGRATQIRVVNDAPLLAGGGLRLCRDLEVDDLPAEIARLSELLELLTGPVPGPVPRWGRVRWARRGNF